MRSVLSLFICLCLGFPLITSAQKATKKQSITGPVFTGGIQANIYNSIEPDNGVVSHADKITTGGGIFLRYYLGQHMALETGFNYDISQKGDDVYELYPSSPGIGTLTRTVRSKSIHIPLSVQYHFFTRESVIRPYVGLGLGYSHYTHDITDRQQDRSLSFDSTANRTAKDNSVSIQFAQGLTYQLNSRLQINEALFYELEEKVGRQNVGVRIGIAYTLK